ncbi:Exosome complex component CSL4 [Perkinsus chesapeaki]|uniref:Exosome complex component CSL4 n=1 Tax=Perkinsus chesapeaki TaxID=330153 RepID=A0A7J6MSU4_PERCH|nr:Exosome complex component CSL4 [Perkinsus chesapeaki]
MSNGEIGSFVSFGDFVWVPEGVEVTAASGLKSLGDGQYTSAKVGTVKVEDNKLVIEGPTAPFVPPSVGDIVYARVARITRLKAECVIVGDHAGRVNSCGFRGHIRVQDVRYYDIDAVAIEDCFRPGDLVRCKVLSMGDSRSYLLTTSGTDASLGVVMATSVNGHPLVPISWRLMKCSVTGELEKRKVARPVWLKDEENGLISSTRPGGLGRDNGYYVERRNDKASLDKKTLWYLY